MGIDIYLKWPGMEEEDEAAQATGFDTTAGHTGYLREAYHGGPYATKILVREAFESEDCTAEIPAKVLRQRLTSVTEPAMGCDGGHKAAEMLASIFAAAGAEIEGRGPASGQTTPMTVEEAVRIRCTTLYPDSGEEYVEAVVKSFRDFVALAEKKEAQTGKPCTIYASY